MTRATLSLIVVLVLAGCASSSGYPSLARRPSERLAGSAAVVMPAAVSESAAPIPSTDLASRLTALIGQANDAQRQFSARRAVAERAATGSGDLGSESWASASTALAALEAAREPAISALAQLDALEVTQRIALAGAENADTAAIERARDEVAATNDAQVAILTRIRGRIAR